MGQRADEICSGLVVLEFGSASLPAAIACSLLADHGARVIKVEPPEGDLARSMSPSSFLVRNRGKESVVADLRTADGRAYAADLARSSDVLVEGFGPGVAEDFGIGSDQLLADNPGLVYCSVKGFAGSGSLAALRAYEGIVAAKAGYFSQGKHGFRPGPIFPNFPAASYGAGMLAFGGTMAALVVRESTGRGQRVDASMYTGLTGLDYFGTMTWQYMQQQPDADSPMAATGGKATRHDMLLPTKDGRWIIVIPALRHQARSLVLAAGLSHLADEPRFARAPEFASIEDAQEWEDALWAVFRERTWSEWEPVLMSDPDIPFELVRNAEEALRHPQLLANGFLVELTDPEAGPVEQVGKVFDFESGTARIERSAPLLGENTGAVEQNGQADRPRAPAPSHPLAGTTIVELGYFYAMPFGVTMAAALGARVIKLEPLDGDPMRWSYAPPEVGGAKVMEGKESLPLDLRTEEGRAIVLRLVENADVFVSGFRPDTADKLGLGYEDLRALNAGLLYLQAPGYGQLGPMRRRPMYANTATACVGGFYAQSGYWIDSPLNRDLDVAELQAIVGPRLRGPIPGDGNGALSVFAALVLGLFHRTRTGGGQLVSSALIAANAHAYADWLVSGSDVTTPPLPDPEQYGLGPRYRLYRAADGGWVFLAAPSPKDVARVVDAFTALLPAALCPPDLSDRLHADDASTLELLTEVFATRPASEWERELTPRGVAAVEVFDGTMAEFTSQTAELLQAGLVREVEHPAFGRIIRHGPPVNLSETPCRIEAGCLHGQHTRALLAELGYEQAEIEELVDRGIVMAAP